MLVYAQINRLFAKKNCPTRTYGSEVCPRNLIQSDICRIRKSVSNVLQSVLLGAAPLSTISGVKVVSHWIPRKQSYGLLVQMRSHDNWLHIG